MGFIHTYEYALPYLTGIYVRMAYKSSISSASFALPQLCVENMRYLILISHEYIIAEIFSYL